MKKTISFLLLFLIFNLFIIFVPNAAAAASTGPTDSEVKTPTKFPNPLGEANKTIDIPILIGRVINAILGIVGSLALVMFVYGGLIWMTAAGNQERVKKGGDILMWAAIGLVVIFSAYAMVKFVIEGMIEK